jgi:hypothetical protein
LLTIADATGWASIAMLNAKILYGAVFVAVTGLVNPDRDANTFDPHESVDKCTRTAFVAANPVVVHDNCRSQLMVNVQSVA